MATTNFLLGRTINLTPDHDSPRYYEDDQVGNIVFTVTRDFFRNPYSLKEAMSYFVDMAKYIPLEFYVTQMYDRDLYNVNVTVATIGGEPFSQDILKPDRPHEEPKFRSVFW